MSLSDIHVMFYPGVDGKYAVFKNKGVDCVVIVLSPLHHMLKYIVK